MSEQNQLIVTSAEFARQFGSLRQTRDDAIVITHHGRETHVLLPMHRYRELLSQPAQGGARIPTPPSMAELASWIQQGCITLAADFTVMVANGIAHAMVERADGQLLGHNIFTAVPELNGSLVEGYIRRAVEGRERCAADIPSIFRDGAWIRLEVIPTADSTTLLFRDITDDVQRHRLADAKKALVDAIGVHGGIGYLRVGTRGQIERAEQAVCRMLKLSEERLRGVTVTDIVPISQRIEFREALESALNSRGSAMIETELMVNDGSLIRVRAAISELRGAYGSEGAVVVITPCTCPI